MSFLSNGSDSEDDDYGNNLFSHAERNFAIARKHAAARAAQAKLEINKKPVDTPKKSAKRKSKDLESQGEDEDEEEPPKKRSSTPQRDEKVSSRDKRTRTTRAQRSSVQVDEGEELGPSPQQPEVAGPDCQIVLEDDVTAEVVALQPEKPVDSEPEESDDEFAEIARQARLLARRKQNKDNTVEIFLSSPLPNTQPLRVYLRLSQQLKIVREAWCKRQNFVPGFEQSVYLTYRGRKIYDSSTSRSLGLDVDADGNLYRKGDRDRNGTERVHLEAVTEAFLEEQAQAATANEDDQLAGLQPAAEAIIHIVLRAQKMEDFRLKVKPTTTIAKITSAYRKRRGVPSEQQVVLVLDGEDLAPDTLIQEHEISDMDVVEVHLR